MAITYDTLGSTVTVHPVGAVPPSQLNTAVAIIGGYDAGNADSSVAGGEVTTVNSGTEAETMFGADCELTYQAKLAFTNGASTVHGVPVPESQTTETFGTSTATASGTLSNAPAMDPRVHPDHEITANDVTAGTSMTVNVVDGTPSTPSDSDTLNINPETGNWEADATSEYDITYSYGTWDGSMDAAIAESPRNIALCAEDDSLVTTMKGKLETAESNFNFTRVVAGSLMDFPSGQISSYTPASEDWRVIEVAPSRGTSPSGQVRTVGAIAGLLAGQPVNVEGSITYDTVSGLDSLKNEYAPTTAEQFTQVTAITRSFEVAGGYTTSSESSFRDVYAVEIIDLVVEQLFERVKVYSGGSNSFNAQQMFESRLRRTLNSLSPPASQPPLLATPSGEQPYTVNVSTGATDTETDVDIGIQVAPIAKEVTLDISVGPFQFGGATV